MLIEVWSDVVCPWCAVGKANLEAALGRWQHADEVVVRWRSFELDPRRPRSFDGDYVELLARKYGTTREQAQAMVDRMTEAGAAAGIEFRFDLARPGNTFDAHRVLHLAHERGIQGAVKDRLLAGYHGEGAAIGAHDELVRLASEAGLDADEVAATLSSDAYADAVRADEAQAVEYGITGVPFFVLGGAMGVPGAQPVDTMLTALDRARDRARRRRSVITRAAARGGHDHPAGEACVDGQCAV